MINVAPERKLSASDFFGATKRTRRRSRITSGTSMAKKFSASVRRILAERAGQRCANPDCRRVTSGPSHDGSGRSTNHGRACHITAASTTGPRYDSTLTEEQRFHPDNGIWLCANCGDEVDKNENLEKFPVELLRNWKEFHESLSGTDHASIENRRIYLSFAQTNSC